MRNYQFRIHFENGYEDIWASCLAAAKILAQAKRINDAKNWNIVTSYKLAEIY
jgi:hypothetical protein